ncbi:hypothetical protein LTR66_017793, partial [Elasticomyces elasticus]
NNPNNLPFEPEAYLGVPLFAEGKCYAHFGMMWTKEGFETGPQLSWGFMEMFMHSIEDLISAKLLAGQGFAKTKEAMQAGPPKVIPQSAITATQSLKLYARSLSHELRTPMQGVVGMLDLMYATVQEQIEGSSSISTRKVFQALKDSIEVVQDSSKRAVEAADNVVQAYDLNMQVPDTPGQEAMAATNMTSYFESVPKMTKGSQIINPGKRKRSDDPNTLGAALQEAHNLSSSRRTSPRAGGVNGVGTITLPDPSLTQADFDLLSTTTPGHRQSNIRDVMPIVINESLRVGGRPEYAVSEAISNGERTEVRTKSSNGTCHQQIITWVCEDDVPYIVPLDERDLSKLIGAVFLNAVKFTENGTIDIRVRLSASKRYTTINIKDNGTGIPHNFQPELFKAFSKEDDSLTRHSEGLGLGLLVAKGLARRTGGDIILVRSETHGPMRGSDFEIRILLDPNEAPSRASTPFGAPSEQCAPRSAPQWQSPATSPGFAGSQASSPLTRDSPALRKSRVASPQAHITSAAVQALGSNSYPQEELAPPKLHRRVSSTPRVPLMMRPGHDRQLAEKYPLQFLVAEDNKINRKLLVNMLGKFGYKNVYEAFDVKEAVRIMSDLATERKHASSPHNFNGRSRYPRPL